MVVKARFLSEESFGPSLAVRRWRLPSGLRIVALPDSSAPVVSYQTWLGVGSRHEVKGKTGLAHFFEHLMFNETSTHPQGEFDRLLEEVGAESNAATWTDWTCFYENLPARELPLAIELEADRLANLVLQHDPVESERQVVMSERRDRIDDDVDGRAGEALWATAFRKHHYRHPTLGWMRDIRRFAVRDCERFYRTWYAPNNVVLAIAGRFDERSLLAQIADSYGAMKKSRLPREA
ncbi:MAG: pitrilysin family protein, partial [Myxococcota bacterium]